MRGRVINASKGLAGGAAAAVMTSKAIDWVNSLSIGGKLHDWLHPDPAVSNHYSTAITPRPRDPLAIDLDGDGIEVLGANAPIVLFDHNADGVKTGTGWLKGDDAWLVLDRNGNGQIDSGRELFGIDTLVTRREPTSLGTWYEYIAPATDGFQALRGEDSDANGIFDAGDASFGTVRLWRDLNSDGVSQSNELLSLEQAGIASISLNSSFQNKNLGNGNVQGSTSVVQRADGSQSAAGSVLLGGTASNLHLADNPFYREFQPIPVSDAAAELPEMAGSGWVRDLREAMSLDNAASDTLLTALQAYAETATYDGQRAQLSGVLELWAASTGQLAGFADGQLQVGQTRMIEEDKNAAAPSDYNPATGSPNDRHHRFVLNEKLWDHVPHGSLENKYYARFSLPPSYYGTSSSGVQVLGAEGTELLRQLQLLEVFNGRRFLDQVITVRPSSGGGSGGGGGGGGAAMQQGMLVELTRINLDEQQLQSIQLAYEALTESVHESLALQTRLRPYLDAIELHIDESGVSFDGSPLLARLEATRSASAWDGIADLAELTRFAGHALVLAGVDGPQLLRSWIDALPTDDPLRQRLPELRVFIEEGDASGSFAGDLILGGDDNQRIYGGEGDDWLLGGAGVDTLLGENGNDTLDGGAGNDEIVGGLGSDVVRFGRGDGQDTVRGGMDEVTQGKLDVIELKAGVAPDDLILSTSGSSLTIRIAGSTDQMTVVGFIFQDRLESNYSPLQQMRFADGTVWTAADILARVLAGTERADSASGTLADELITGLAGNDTLSGRGGNDTIDGGAGNDWLNGNDGNDVLLGADGDDLFYSGSGDDFADGGSGDDRILDAEGDDTLLGGEGHDLLEGGAGNDTLEGGAGNDDITGGLGSDVVRFGRGDGQDIVRGTTDATVGKFDVIELREGIALADVILHTSGTQLTIKIAGTTDQILVTGFLNEDSTSNLYGPLQQLKFADGTIWTPADIMVRVLAGTEGADSATGTSAAELITGLSGNDTLSGRGGNDTLEGGAGADHLTGDDGDDLLLGGVDADNLSGGIGNDSLDAGAGNDRAYGGDGNDVVLAGEGHDTLEGGAGNDTLEGGAGNDDITGGLGSDVVRFGRGDGQDIVRGTTDPTVGKLDVIELREGIAPADVILHTSGTQLTIKIAGTTDQILVTGFLDGDSTSNSYSSLQQLRFADGTIWTPADIMVRVLAGTEGADSASGTSATELITGLGGNDTLSGRGGNDTLDGGAGADNLSGDDGDDVLLGGTEADVLYGGTGNDSLDAGAGNDRAYGNDGNDVVLGGEGHDTLEGGAGNDTIDAGAGNDDITGGLGSDVIRFGRGDGQDVVRSTNDAAAGKLDVLELRAGIAPADVVLNTSGSTLILKVAGTSDQISFYDFSWQESTGNAWNPLQQIKFSDGTIWTPADIMTKVLAGTEGAGMATGLLGAEFIAGLGGNDTLSGRGGNDTLDGGAGADNLSGDAGDDVLLGGTEVDVLYGGTGNDSLDAGAGNDRAYGDDGSDVVLGGEGHDTLEGGAGNDTLEGGAGNDDITGGLGSDVIVFGRGDGQDVLRSTNDAAAGKQEVLRFKAGISAADVTMTASSGTLVIKIAGTTDQITVYDFLWQDNPANSWNPLQRIEFADGSAWSLSDIMGRLMTGNTGANAIRGTIGADSISGLGGNDTLSGLDGADTLDGGSGNDSLIGGTGGDVYRFGRDAGADRLNENDVTANVLDWVEFGADVMQSDVAFVRNANALEIRINGTSDSLTVENWFVGAQHRVERFKFSDNSVMTDQQVAGLVQAMAGFNVPAAQSLASADGGELMRRHQGMAVNGVL